MGLRRTDEPRYRQLLSSARCAGHHLMRAAWPPRSDHISTPTPVDNADGIVTRIWKSGESASLRCGRRRWLARGPPISIATRNCGGCAGLRGLLIVTLAQSHSWTATRWIKKTLRITCRSLKQLSPLPGSDAARLCSRQSLIRWNRTS
jgi:hypothetical protein